MQINLGLKQLFCCSHKQPIYIVAFHFKEVPLSLPTNKTIIPISGCMVCSAVFLCFYGIPTPCVTTYKPRQTTWKTRGALSIQQKFRFEISVILRVQWNGTFRLHRPDPSYRALGYCSCKQDTKERYWGQQFCQMERDSSVRPTEITRPVKEDHLQS